MISATFRIGNQEFVGFNGGPNFPFSLLSRSSSTVRPQEEIDYRGSA